MKLEERLASFEPKQVVAAGLIAAVIWYILPMDNVAALKSRQRTLSDEIQAVAVELEDVRLAMANNEVFESQVRETASVYKEILSYFPAEFSTPDFMIALTNLMKEAGGSRIRVQPMDKVSASDIYDQHPFAVEMEGTYPFIMKFLSDLTRMSQITSVRAIKMVAVSADSRRSVLKFQGVVSGYSYRGNLGADQDATLGEEPMEETQ